MPERSEGAAHDVCCQPILLPKSARKSPKRNNAIVESGEARGLPRHEAIRLASDRALVTAGSRFFGRYTVVPPGTALLSRSDAVRTDMYGGLLHAASRPAAMFAMNSIVSATTLRK